jgi:hypothetical protein
MQTIKVFIHVAHFVVCERPADQRASFVNGAPAKRVVDSARSGTYQLKQVNNVVVGNTMPVLGQNAAQIDGTMRAGLVEGTWRGPTGETGWFNMRLSADGKAFSGQYGFNGRKAEGALVGHLAA